jgi:hypothetical protein
MGHLEVQARDAFLDHLYILQFPELLRMEYKHLVHHVRVAKRLLVGTEFVEEELA